MTRITAKIKCQSKTGTGWPVDEPDVRVIFGPDYANGRNKEWASATPALHLDMTVKAGVAEHFTPGATYTLTFEENDE